MPTISAGDVCLVTVLGTINNQRVINTFPYIVNNVTGTPSDAAAFAALDTKLRTALGLIPRLLNVYPSDYIGDAIWYQVIAPTRFRKIQTVFDNLGLWSQDARTANVQASITRYGALANRANIGGIRIPISPAENAITEGLISANMKSALELLATQMRATQTITTPAMSFIPLVGTAASPAASTPLDGTIVQPQVRVMVRRTVGRGI